MHGTHPIMQAGRLVDDDVSITVVSTVDDGSGPVAELWFTTSDAPQMCRVELRIGEWCMLGGAHHMAARDVIASTRVRRGAVVLEIEEIDAADE